ncbi:MAG: hypothetical protein ACR2FY_22065 [Pirellulaceae bacterium]
MPTQHLALRAMLAFLSILAVPCMAGEEFRSTSLLMESEALAAETAASDLGEAADDCCCQACYGPSWFTGAEITFMGYDARTGGRINLSFDDSGTAGTDYSVRDGNNAQSLTYTPRIWIGRQFGEKWGVVGRFWNLTDFTTHRPEPVPGQVNLTNFATKTEFDRARLYTIDIEAIRSFTPGKWKIDGTIGARQASILTDAKIDVFGVFTTGNFVNMSLSNGFKFDGAGVTSALIGRRQIGQSNAHLFLGVRASQLWGRTDSFGRAVGTVADSPSAPLVGAATVTRNNAIADMTIAELQVGVQWDFPIESAPMLAFFRTSFEYQNWSVNGPLTGGAGFGGTIGTLTTNSFSRAGVGEAQLYGLAIATGFTW